MLQVKQICSWSVGSDFCFRFKQLNRLSDPRVEQRVDRIFESTLLEFSNDANIFEILLSTTEKLFQYRNLPHKFSYACQNQWFGNETSVSHDQPPLGVVREYACTYLGIDPLHYSEVWLGVQPRRFFRPLLQACRVRGSSRHMSTYRQEFITGQRAKVT